MIQLFIKSRFLIKIFSENFHFADDVQSCMKRSNNNNKKRTLETSYINSTKKQGKG